MATANHAEALAKVIEEILDGRPQKWLSDASGLTTAKISRLMNAEHEPNISDLIALAGALKIKPDEMLRLTLFPQGLPPPMTGEISPEHKLHREENEKARLRYEKERRKATDALEKHAPYAKDAIAPDVSGGLAFLSKFQGLSPVLQKMVLALVYEDTRFVERIPVTPEARALMLKLFGPFLKAKT